MADTTQEQNGAPITLDQIANLIRAISDSIHSLQPIISKVNIDEANKILAIFLQKVEAKVNSLDLNS